MTTFRSQRKTLRCLVVEAYRLDRYDNYNDAKRLIYVKLQKPIVWIGMTTARPFCAHPDAELQKPIVRIGMTTQDIAPLAYAASPIGGDAQMWKFRLGGGGNKQGIATMGQMGQGWWKTKKPRIA